MCSTQTEQAHIYIGLGGYLEMFALLYTDLILCARDVAGILVCGLDHLSAFSEGAVRRSACHVEGNCTD